jgi:hypothetical protein
VWEFIFFNCTKVKYQWHFIKCVKKALRLLPGNVVHITFSVVKTVLILMLRAKNTEQLWVLSAYEQRTHGQLNQFPRGIYVQQVETGLHPSFSVTTPLCSLIYFHSLYTLTVTGCSLCPNTHTVHPCKDSRSSAVPVCDTASSNYGRGMWHFLELFIVTPSIEACISHSTYPYV